MIKKECPQNKLFTPLAAKLVPHQLKVESVAVTVLLLAFFGRVDYSAIANIVFMAGFVALAAMYYITTFRAMPKGTQMKTCLTYRLLGVGQAISCIGMQFLLVGGSGGKAVIVTGALTLGIASISLVLARNFKTVDRDDSQIDIVRGLVILAAVLAVMNL